MPDIPQRTNALTVAQLAASNTALALDLYGQLRGKEGNLAFSPFSITAALTMTWAGARGETAAQLARALHAEGGAEEALDAAGRFAARLHDPRSPLTVRIANRLFGDEAYVFEQAYLDRTRAAFGAPLEPVDFQHAARASRARINAWVAGETRDRIRDLLPEKAVTEDTRLVLVNAIYFLGKWSTPFEQHRTRSAPFHLAKSRKTQVPTMEQADTFGYAVRPGVKLLEMPYEGGALAMTLVLPERVDGLDALERQLSPAALETWFAALHLERVLVSLPRFEIDPPASLRLGNTLEALGVRLAFDRDRADFTRIADPPAPEDRLCIDEVFHKAFVKLDESGTEAAAATAVAMMFGGGAGGRQKPPPEFRADHPFLFFLRDVRSGMILFMGRVSDPTAQ